MHILYACGFLLRPIRESTNPIPLVKNDAWIAHASAVRIAAAIERQGDLQNRIRGRQVVESLERTANVRPHAAGSEGNRYKQLSAVRTPVGVGQVLIADEQLGGSKLAVPQCLLRGGLGICAGDCRDCVRRYTKMRVQGWHADRRQTLHVR